MSWVKNKKIRIALSLGCLVAIVLLAFQNCMQLPDGQEEEASLPTSFPFEVKADTFGFMSCDAMITPEPQAYFTVRAGALDPGSASGLSFTPDFQSYAHEKGLSEVNDIMAGDPYYDMRLNLSLRRRDSLSSTPVGPPGLTIPDKFWDGTRLSTNTLLTNVYASTTPRAPMKSYSYATRQKLLAQVVLNPWALSDILAQLGNQSMIVLGFQRGASFDSQYLVTGNSIGEKFVDVFGAGFTPSFAYPVQKKPSDGQDILVQAHGIKVLSTLSQYNLAKQDKFRDSEGNITQWNCPAYAQYLIVSDPAYSSTAGCTNNPTVPVSTSKEYIAWKAANEILNMNNANHWIVDQTNRCIIRNTTAVPHPGGNSCYPDISKVGWRLDGLNNATCGGNTGKSCPHYFSLCATYIPQY